MKLPFAAAALCLLALSPAGAQEEDDYEADPAPPYRWLEVGIGTQRIADPAGGGMSADTAFRLATSVDVAPHFYLCGSFTSANYDSRTLNMLGGGIGAHAPLLPNLHGIVQLTLESVDGNSVNQQGYGLEAGARWFARTAEFGLTVEHSRLEAKGGPFAGAEDTFTGINLAAVVPVSEALSITVRIERLTGTGGDLNEDVDFDTYLVGLRFRP